MGEGAKIVGVDAKTGKTVSAYTDVKFGDAIALLPGPQLAEMGLQFAVCYFSRLPQY